MELQAYLDQTQPVRMPHVLLQPGEYVQGHFFGSLGNRIASVFIPKIGYSYCVKEGGSRLYTVDSDGNPKSPSCFHLK